MSSQDEQEQIHQALNRAYFYLKFRPRSEEEVRDYLVKKGEKYQWSESIIDASITSLKETHLVDDTAFVEWFVNQRSSGKPKSIFALSHELQKYGVKKETVSEFFERNPVNEEDLALKALRRRWQRFQYLDRKVRFQKAAAFLSSRGFNFEIIKKSIHSLEQG